MVWSYSKIDEDCERKLREREKKEYGERNGDKEERNRGWGEGLCVFFTLLQNIYIYIYIYIYLTLNFYLFLMSKLYMKKKIYLVYYTLSNSSDMMIAIMNYKNIFWSLYYKHMNENSSLFYVFLFLMKGKFFFILYFFYY